MKEKTTRKDLRNRFEVITTGYCNLQNLLRFDDPDYYCTRAEGWAFDAYIFGGYAILDGYDGIGKMVDHDLMKKYDDKAEEIADGYPTETDYQTTKEKLHELVYQFCEEATNGR